MQRFLPLGLLILVLAAPIAAADAPLVVVRLDAEKDELVLKPGEHTAVGLNVTVEFKEVTCAANTRVGVDLVPPENPSWLSGDPHPDGDQYTYPKQTKMASLSLHVDDEAPAGSEGQYRLQPVVKLPGATECGGVEPKVDAPEFQIAVKTPTSTESASATIADTGAGEAPSPSLAVLLTALGGAFFLRRRK